MRGFMDTSNTSPCSYFVGPCSFPYERGYGSSVFCVKVHVTQQEGTISFISVFYITILFLVSITFQYFKIVYIIQLELGIPNDVSITVY